MTSQIDSSKDELRYLTDEEEYEYKIDEVVSFAIRDANFQDEYTDKSINSFSLMQIGNDTLTFSVQFSDPNSISQDLLDPDILDIEFLLPQIIIDAIT